MSILSTVKSWIEQIYADNGLWPTVGVVVVCAVLIGGMAYLGINPPSWIVALIGG